MKLFFAAATTVNDMKGMDRAENADLLFSYHYYNQKKKKLFPLFKKYVDDPKNTIFLDSGAFSAMSLGKPIKLDEYIEFIKMTNPTYYAVLDDIKNPDRTIINQEKMEAEGLNPVPVFHMGENIKFLYHYIENYDFVALGGMVYAKEIQPWLDAVWMEIMRLKPSMKVHGFGMTNLKLMKRYPFYSCDSSTWAGSVRFARVNMWNHHKNKFYDLEAWKWARDEGLDYQRGEPIKDEFRLKLIAQNCISFMKMRDYITEYHSKSDFSHIKNQLNLFT